MRHLLGATAIAMTLLVAGASQASGNLLTNGSFETNHGLYNPGFDGWSDLLGGAQAIMGDSPGSNPSIIRGAEDGNWYLGDATSCANAISQTFTDVAGRRYLVSGWVASDGFGNGSPSDTSDFSLAINQAVFASANPVVAQGWTQYSTTFVGTGSDTLTILSQNDAAYQYFDNFSVTAAAPEPAGWALMLTGVSVLGAGLRLRRRPSQA